MARAQKVKRGLVDFGEEVRNVGVAEALGVHVSVDGAAHAAAVLDRGVADGARSVHDARLFGVSGSCR